MDKMNLSNESSEEASNFIFLFIKNHLNKEISNVKSDLWTSRRYENSLTWLFSRKSAKKVSVFESLTLNCLVVFDYMGSKVEFLRIIIHMDVALH
ncbi:hypothetical protein T06_6030 [Trichinella sp. T6]|nr:hypothetical protein T06_6030 [Trichinella sp. T6]